MSRWPKFPFFTAHTVTKWPAGLSFGAGAGMDDLKNERCG